MSFIAKLFSKKQLETVQDLQSELELTIKNAQAEFTALVGIKGNLKGLDIISAVRKDSPIESGHIKRYVAKLVEIFLRIESLQLIAPESGTRLQYLQLNYTEELNFCIIPIPGNSTFIIIAVAPNILRLMKVLMKEKVKEKLDQLFPPKLNEPK